MPRYHFNIDVGVDSEGTEYKNLAVAKCEAIKAAGRIISDAAATFWDRPDWTMTVTDPAGLILLRLEILGTEAPAARVGHPT